MSRKTKIQIAAVAGGLLLVYLTFYTTRETEFALITQFGRPVRTVVNAGLHVKWPFQSIQRFDRRLRVYNPRPAEFLTRDKKNLVIDNYVAWRIEDPKTYFVRLHDERSAQSRLEDILGSETRNSIAKHDLIEIVRTDKNRKPQPDESLKGGTGVGGDALPEWINA